MNNALWILSSSIQMVRHICILNHLDILLIDLEHSSFTYSELTGFIETIRSHGKSSCIRLSTVSRENILHSVELNPDMVMAPAISTKEQIERAVNLFHTPPKGTRGFSPYSYPAIRGAENSLQPTIRTKLCLQIESESALDSIDIFNLPNVIDAIFIGRYDLAISLGVEINSDSYLRLLVETGDKIRSFGLKVGTVCLNHNEYNYLAPHYDFLSLGSDVTRMLESSRNFQFPS